MPSVLLISEQERLHRLYKGLEREGAFLLRVAPTLAQGEEEMVLRRVDHVFVENGISGLPGPMIVHHLRDLLDEGAQVILMARDAVDAHEVEDVAGTVLDLSQSDGQLRLCISDAIERIPLPAKAQPPVGPPRAPAGSAKKLLFKEPDREVRARRYKPKVGRDKRALWAIPLVVGVVVVSATIYLGRREAPRPVPAPPTAQIQKIRQPLPARVAPSVQQANPAAQAPLPQASQAAQAAQVPRALKPRQAPQAMHAAPATESAQGPGTQAQGPSQRSGTQAQAKPAVGDQTAADLEYIRYIVKPGDSVEKILVEDFHFTTKAAKVVVPEFMRLNHIQDLALIKYGQSLVIPVPKQQVKKWKLRKGPGSLQIHAL